MHKRTSILSLLIAFSLSFCTVFAEEGNSKQVGKKKNTGHFSNDRTLPSWNTLRVPRTKNELQQQVGHNYNVVRRGMFLIASDLDKKRFDYVVDGVFACCQEILSKEFFRKRPQEIVTIYIFKSKKSYINGLADYFAMEPISPYGHYGHRKRYIVVNYATGPGTFVHEMTHALMAADFPKAPIWVSEGIASLYEQCKVEGDSLRGDQNWRLPELKKGIKENKLTPLEALFSSDTKVFRMVRESLHYAQSRYFCKYMEELGVLRKVYANFRDNVDKDPTGITAVEDAFGKPISVIEKDWLAWVDKQEWQGKAPSVD